MVYRQSITAFVILLCFLAEAVSAPQANFTRRQFEEDFDYLWQSISDDYAYFDQKETDWKKVREIYRPQLSVVKTRNDFVGLLESVLEELYDAHTHLNTNTASSPRLIPSGTDIWAEWLKETAVVTEVKPGSSAAKAGVKSGMHVVAINGIAVADAVNGRVGKSLPPGAAAARDWALRTLLAGRRNEKRVIEVIGDGVRRTLSIKDESSRQSDRPGALLDYRRIEKQIGYIRVNNSLGDTDLVKEFDLALAALRDTRGLILDLRDTPSGGNTTVARGLMGRFISRDKPYQKHSIPTEERQFGIRRSWIELVSPRGEFTYTAPVVVLVSHWTGSMGEGIAIGMDGMRRATIVGTEMARLMGATSGIRLPNTGIGVNFPTEKLFHVDGTPREKFVPPVYTGLQLNETQGEDVILNRGLRVLRARSRKL